MSWGPSGQVQARNPRPYRSPPPRSAGPRWPDRKSTRLNSSHSQISYAVFCLKKKKTNTPLSFFHVNTEYQLHIKIDILHMIHRPTSETNISVVHQTPPAGPYQRYSSYPRPTY